jgi:Transglycosylase SLT domain
MRRFVFALLALALVFTDALAENSTASLDTHPTGRQRTWQSTFQRIAQNIDPPAVDPAITDGNRPTNAETAISSEQICQAIELAARENNLPVQFLIRLIWQESRFNPSAVSRAGAQGIAQFMPTTAAWRGLENPFDPIPAIRKSAELLRALIRQFGNLGLAAAAYNAGSKRVQDWIDGRTSLPTETQAYVRIVTGHSTDEWRMADLIALNPPAAEGVVCPPVAQSVPRREVAPSIPGGKVATVITQQGQTWLVLRVMSGSDTNGVAAYHQIQRQYLSVLGAHGPLVIRHIREGSFGYEVRVPAINRQSAEKLCSNLHAVGGSCLAQ